MTDTPNEPTPVELGRYWTILRRRWWVVALGVILGVLLASAYLVTTPRRATATAVVNVSVISDQAFPSTRAPSGLLDTSTEQQLARSSQVLTLASDKLGIPVNTLRANSTAQPVPDSTIVQVSYKAHNGADASAGADAIAKSYLKFRAQLAKDRIGTSSDKLTSQLDERRNDLVSANSVLARAQTGSRQAIQAQSQVQLLNLQISNLVTQINTYASIDTSGGSLVTDAADNNVSISPSRRLVVGTGGALGLILGAIAAFVVNRLDRRIYDEEPVTAAGGGVALTQLRTRRATVPVTGADYDAISSLRERLLVSLAPSSVLAIADLTRGRSPSDVGVNLAHSLTEAGRRVRLVLPDHGDEFVRTVVSRLALERVEDAPVPTYRSTTGPGLAVIVPSADTPEGVSGTLLANLLRTGPADAMTVISLTSNATRSLRLAAGRVGHSFILVAARRATRLSAVSQLAQDLRAVHADVWGYVLVSRRRRLDVSAGSEDHTMVPPPARLPTPSGRR